MARRRPSRASSIKKNQRSFRQAICEALEERLQFVVLHGGDVFQFSNGGTGGGGNGGTGWERVVVTGNTTVELVGALVNTNTGQLEQNVNNGLPFTTPLTAMDGFIVAGPDAGAVGGGYLSKLATPPPDVETLYAMDVVQSDSTSGIAVASITDPTTPGQHPMLPYAGQTTLRINPAAISNPNQPTYTVTGPANGGGIVLGALTLQPAGGGGQPVDSEPILPTLTGFNNVEPTANAGQFTYVPTGLVTPGLVVPSGSFGSFLFGGTVTGNVTIHGSINQFYAGWIVTGNSFGEADTGIVTVPQNFNVDGDLRDLISAGSLGTDDSNNGLLAVGTPRYSSGFDMHVGGRIGQINTATNFLGSLTVTNNNPVEGLPSGTPEIEVENRGPANSDFWDGGILGTPSGGGAAPFLINDTFATPQYVGNTDNSGNITIDGQLQALPTVRDFVDYYAVPLIAGQTITVQVTEPAPLTGDLDCGVFDPDGRLIATDYNRVDATQTEEQPFQFTATEPGVYRFAVGETPNSNFDANGGGGIVFNDFLYTLSIQNVGNLAIGGLVAGGIILDNPNGAATVTTGTMGANIDALHVVNGDFGAAVGGTSVISEYGFTSEGVNSFAVDNGNLRAVVGGQIGAPTAANSATYLSPSVFAPHGTVGLLSALTGALSWNVFISPGIELTQAQSTAFSIGGDYQWVNSPAGTFLGDLVAQGNIGTIQCANMTTALDQGYFQVNAAFNPALHGTIDLIDSQGSIGTVGTGGPGITTGPGGNVRYIHIGPTATIFRDALFGGGSPDQTLYQPGEAATITDDSGTVVSLTPVGGTNPTVTTTGTGANATTHVTYAAPASITVLTYPIRGSGGAAIVRVISQDGLSVAASGAGGAQSAEIGTIELDGVGTAVTNNNTGTGTGTGTGSGAGTPGGPPVKPTGNTKLPYILPTVPPLPSLKINVPLTLTISGSVKLDTFQVTGQPAIPPGDGSLVLGTGQVTSLTNTTGGEIVNIHLNSLGTLTSNGVVGVAAEHNTAAAVQGLVHNPLSEDAGPLGEPWTYPFLAPTSMVRVLGNIVSITAAGLGNVYAGFITMTPGPDPITPGATPEDPASPNVLAPGVNGNIGSISAMVLGPLVAAGSIGSTTARGGFAPHGSGAVGGAGLFAVGVIGPVASNGDMAGEIVSDAAIASITVTNGSIINGAIGDLQRFDFAEQRAGGVVLRGFTTPITRPQLDLGPITVTGNGGIIGTEILGDHIGPITVANSGFGLFDSLITMGGDGTLAGISVGGYGIRDGRLAGGASFGPIVVHGDGSNLPVTNFPASVRQSENGTQFTSAGQPISFINDIDSFLGTTASTPSIIGVTDSGVIEDVTVEGSRDLASVTAYSIRGRDLTTLKSVVPGFTPALTPNVTTFNVANSLGVIAVTGPVNGLDVTTGRTSKYTFGGDVSALNLTVAGPIGSLVLKSSLVDNSSINAIGPSGHISSLTIDGNLAGSVTSTTYIQMLHVLGSITGTVQAARIGTIHISGAVGTGGLTINGPLTNLIVDNTFGPSGSPIQVNGNAGTIRIHGDLATNINVTGNLKQLIVGGNVLTNSISTIGGILNLLKVSGGVQAGATITAELIKRQLVKGQIQGIIQP